MSAARFSYVLPLGLCMFAACAFEPEGRQRMEPPEIYREWWAGAEQCTAQRRDFDRIRWYVVEEVFETPQGKAAGWRSGDEITIARGYLDHPMVVRHEMVHVLIDQGGHPKVPFEIPCKATWASWDRSYGR